MSTEDFAHRADALLQSLEPRFLEILAEHSALHSPKESGGHLAADSFTGGFSAGSPTVDVIIRSNEQIYSRYVSALAHYEDHGCIEGMDMLAEFAKFILLGIREAGAKVGWFTIEEEED